MARATSRPLSPHLSVYKWGPHMLVSILHRATGSAMATAGVAIFVWWLAAVAAGAGSYERFVQLVIAAEPGDGTGAVTNIIARVVGIGLSWAFFQHMASGARHLVLDTGAGYELRRNKLGAIATMVFSAVATLLCWGYILGVKG